MCGCMVDVQSPTAEIRRGKKEEERRKKKQDKNIMVCPITSGDHNDYISKCISEGLMHVAAWYRGITLNKLYKIRGISVSWSDLNNAKFCCASTKMCEVSAVEICATEKVDQSSPKSIKTCYAPMPVIVPNFIFYTFHYFGAPGYLQAPGPKFTSLLDDV